MNPLTDIVAAWPEISGLIDEALALPPAGRAAWLAALDGPRATHRETVRRLLAVHDDAESDDFLEALPRLTVRADVRLQGEPASGLPIDAFCSAHGLGIPARIALLLQAMAAMAHARVVVHRGLAPGNFRVTPAGQVQLLGLAIAPVAGNRTDGAAPAPDPARAVHAMAMLAVDLLAGSRTDPLRGDLDAVMDRALGKAPTGHPPTLEAFARDLRRHLAQRPPPGRGERPD